MDIRKIVLVLVFVGMLISACATEATKASQEQNFSYRDEDLSITTDLKTGCDYIIMTSHSSASQSVSITLRMKNNGEPYCRGAE